MNPEYKDCFRKKDEERKELLLDLANFCKNYTNEVCNKVIMKFGEIVENDMIKKMLHELRIRESKLKKALKRKMEFGKKEMMG